MELQSASPQRGNSFGAPCSAASARLTEASACRDVKAKNAPKHVMSSSMLGVKLQAPLANDNLDEASEDDVGVPMTSSP